MRPRHPILANVRTILLLLSLFYSWALFAQQDDAFTDIYDAGAAVQILEATQGDVVVAGGSVSIIKPVNGDVLAVGGAINISTDVGDDIRAAGGSVTLVGNIGDDAVVAGGNVVVDSATTIGGRAWLFGNTIHIEGIVEGELRAQAHRIILSGRVNGDVDLLANTIEIEPGAVIKGKLSYSAPKDAVIREGAIIEGEVSQSKFEINTNHANKQGNGFLGALMYYLSLTASAIVIVFIFPVRTLMATQQLEDTPFKSAGTGLVILLATPIVALMLLVSVLGMPLGFVLLGLYLSTLIIGFLIAVIWLGDLAFRKLGKQPDSSKLIRAASIAVGAALLMIIDVIPFVGGLIFFIISVMGIGGLVLFLYSAYLNRDNPSLPESSD